MRTPVWLLQAANLCSGLGNAMVTLAIPWLVMERLGSATLAGFVLAAASLPPLSRSAQPRPRRSS